jgi:hypothetical protein
LASALADAGGAAKLRVTYIAARTAVGGVIRKGGANTAAKCWGVRRAIAACPMVADRGRCAADVSASPAVIPI